MVIYFGTVFQNIHITRDDTDGNETHLMKVPLQYSAKDKLLARVDADPEIQRETAIILPRMGFELVNMEYDGYRQVPRSRRTWVKDPDDPNKLKRQFAAVPYNFHFELYIAAKNTEDGTKIVEQIIPFFTPDWTATVNVIPEMNISDDIPIILNSVNLEDSYDGAFEQRRAIIWIMQFTMKGYVYGPIEKKPIIKIAKQNFYIGNTSSVNTTAGQINTSPGLLSNGSPTSNGSASVDYNIIEVDDDFGFIHEYTGEAFGNN